MLSPLAGLLRSRRSLLPGLGRAHPQGRLARRPGLRARAALSLLDGNRLRRCRTARRGAAGPATAQRRGRRAGCVRLRPATVRSADRHRRRAYCRHLWPVGVLRVHADEVVSLAAAHDGRADRRAALRGVATAVGTRRRRHRRGFGLPDSGVSHLAAVSCGAFDLADGSIAESFAGQQDTVTRLCSSHRRCFASFPARFAIVSSPARMGAGNGRRRRGVLHGTGSAGARVL